MSWTPKMDAKLESLWRSGMSARQIGKQLGKLHASVTFRAVTLGLVREPYNPADPAQRVEALKRIGRAA